MATLLNRLAIILIIIWAVGFFGFQVGNLIHLLLVLALISFLFRGANGKNSI
jgi:hypothetical protein